MSKPSNLCNGTPFLIAMSLFLPSGHESTRYCPFFFPLLVTIFSTSSMFQLFTLPLRVFSITFPCTKVLELIHKAGSFQIIQKVFYPSCFTILRLREHIIARKSSRHKPGTRSTIAITNKWANGYLKCEKQAVCTWYFSQP